MISSSHCSLTSAFYVKLLPLFLLLVGNLPSKATYFTEFRNKSGLIDNFSEILAAIYSMLAKMYSSTAFAI
jgi:hypothetical protein